MVFKFLTFVIDDDFLNTRHRPSPPRHRWLLLELVLAASASSADSTTCNFGVGSKTGAAEEMPDVNSGASNCSAGKENQTAKKQCVKTKPQEFFFDVPAEVDLEVYLGQLKRFSLRELQIATDSFNIDNIICFSRFDKVYKGRLADGSLVAVKRMKKERTPVGELQFQQMISKTVHRNLLRLRGLCMNPTERLLVYPYMANGSVASRLRGSVHTTLLKDQMVKGLPKEKKLEMLIDPDLQNNYVESELEQLIQVALLCTQGSPGDRPKMSEVVRMLEGDDLAEWQKVEILLQEVDLAPHPSSDGIIDSTENLHAVEVSGPR